MERSKWMAAAACAAALLTEGRAHAYALNSHVAICRHVLDEIQSHHQPGQPVVVAFPNFGVADATGKDATALRPPAAPDGHPTNTLSDPFARNEADAFRVRVGASAEQSPGTFTFTIDDATATLILKHPTFFEGGCGAPDAFPFLADTDQTHAVGWDPVGVYEQLRAAALQGTAQERARKVTVSALEKAHRQAWVLGYGAHLMMDAAVHGFANTHAAAAERLCEDPANTNKSVVCSLDLFGLLHSQAPSSHSMANLAGQAGPGIQPDDGLEVTQPPVNVPALPLRPLQWDTLTPANFITHVAAEFWLDHFFIYAVGDGDVKIDTPKEFARQMFLDPGSPIFQHVTKLAGYAPKASPLVRTALNRLGIQAVAANWRPDVSAVSTRPDPSSADFRRHDDIIRNPYGKQPGFLGSAGQTVLITLHGVLRFAQKRQAGANQALQVAQANNAPQCRDKQGNARQRCNARVFLSQLVVGDLMGLVVKKINGPRLLVPTGTVAGNVPPDSNVCSDSADAPVRRLKSELHTLANTGGKLVLRPRSLRSSAEAPPSLIKDNIALSPAFQTRPVLRTGFEVLPGGVLTEWLETTVTLQTLLSRRAEGEEFAGVFDPFKQSISNLFSLSLDDVASIVNDACVVHQAVQAAFPGGPGQTTCDEAEITLTALDVLDEAIDDLVEGVETLVENLFCREIQAVKDAITALLDSALGKEFDKLVPHAGRVQARLMFADAGLVDLANAQSVCASEPCNAQCPCSAAGRHVPQGPVTDGRLAEAERTAGIDGGSTDDNNANRTKLLQYPFYRNAFMGVLAVLENPGQPPLGYRGPNAPPPDPSQAPRPSALEGLPSADFSGAIRCTKFYLDSRTTRPFATIMKGVRTPADLGPANPNAIYNATVESCVDPLGFRYSGGKGSN